MSLRNPPPPTIRPTPTDRAPPLRLRAHHDRFVHQAIPQTIDQRTRRPSEWHAVENRS
jgi:hypothetical protein